MYLPTALVGGYFLFAPVYRSFSTGTVVDSGQTFPLGSTAETGTLASANGTSVYFLLAIPVLLAAAPLFTMRPYHQFALNAVASVMLVALTVVGAASIGLFYLPAALLLVIASIRSWERCGSAV